MKKLFIICSVFLALGTFTGCEDNDNAPVPAPKEYEQEALQGTDLQTKLADGAGSIVLTDENVDASTTLIVLTETPELRTDATISYYIEVSNQADMTDNVQLPSSLEETSLIVQNADLDQIVKSFYGKKPQEDAMYARVIGMIEEGSTLAAIKSNIVGPFMVTPVASVIESAYYLIGDYNGWNIENCTAFTHSGKDVYEDPYFVWVGELPVNCNFKIIPQSGMDVAPDGAFWDTALGAAVDNDTSLEGTLINEGCGAIQFETGGFVKITLDMESYTYTMEALEMSPYMYVPGNHQGWNPAEAPQVYSADLDMIYKGHAYLDGGFKFTSHPDWDHTNYGYLNDGELTTDPNAGNINADPAGFYYLEANIGTMTYNMVGQTWGIIGNATPLGWDDETKMTYDRDNNEWSITTDLGEGEFKFRANGDWKYNYGVTDGALVFDGGNIPVTPGNYTIVLKLTNESANAYTITKN